MISVLKDLDKRVAAGVLARAALALEGTGNPAAKEIIEHEDQLRREVMEMARQALGIGARDYTPEDIERLADYLDEQTDQLVGQPDVRAAYARLMESGHLPSDLYDVQILDDLKKNLGRLFDQEEKLIKQTILAPSREQHFGSHKLPGKPCLISLFARKFITPYPHKNFTMLVAGQRGDANKLYVAQAWRIYPSLMDLTGTGDLVDLLRRFADRYGYEIAVGDKKGKFFLVSETLAPSKIHVDLKGQTRTISVVQYQQFDPKIRKQTAALILAVDMTHYLHDLKIMQAEIIS